MVPRSKGKEGEGEMRVYLVVCNGKISSEAYYTLEQAQEFCERRGAKQDVSAWVYTTDEDVYMITDVQVIPRTPQNDEVRE